MWVLPSLFGLMFLFKCWELYKRKNQRRISYHVRLPCFYYVPVWSNTIAHIALERVKAANTKYNVFSFVAAYIMDLRFDIIILKN